ncbi:hypothetical protein GY45DRAFT_430092 [Cubamyces sp. BRFM 1775]|nr:hypothetical protein GY45DRAFT_430092 [Cubamyces sp. BRFM 1775]
MHGIHDSRDVPMPQSRLLMFIAAEVGVCSRRIANASAGVEQAVALTAHEGHISNPMIGEHPTHQPQPSLQWRRECRCIACLSASLFPILQPEKARFRAAMVCLHIQRPSAQEKNHPMPSDDPALEVR